MKTRVILPDGYQNGTALAQAWISEGLILAPLGEAGETGYRMVHKKSVEDLDDKNGMQGPHLNLLALWEKQAIDQNNKAALDRIRAWDEKRLLDSVGEISRQRLSLSFDKDRYPEIQGRISYEDKEAKGIAEVFGVDYRRVLLCRDEYRRLVYWRLMEGQGWEEPPGNCTTVIFKESPVGPIIGRNMDSSPDALAGLQGYGEPLLLKFPEEMGYSYVAAALDVNEYGLTIKGSSIAYPDEKTTAMFWLDPSDLVLRFCKSVDDALELIHRYNAFLGPANLMVCHTSGDAAVIEKSKNSYAIRRTPGRSIFTTDGAAVEEKTRKIKGDSSPACQFALRRHALIESLLEQEEKEPSVEAMWRIISDHTMPSPVCKHLNDMPSFYDLITLYSYVQVPREKECYFKVIRPGPVYTCDQQPKRYAYDFA